MKPLKQFITEKLKVKKNNTHTLFPKTREELIDIIRVELKENGNNCDLNHIDVSAIDDFSTVFHNSLFSGDISQWNVSNARNMSHMFANNLSFNGDLSNWDVSNVEIMNGMFSNSQFNQDISMWDTGNVTTMRAMFIRSYFNQDISNWDISNVRDMCWMFEKNRRFMQNLNSWDVKGKETTGMFDICPMKKKKSFWPKGLNK